MEPIQQMLSLEGAGQNALHPPVGIQSRSLKGIVGYTVQKLMGRMMLAIKGTAPALIPL